MADPKEQRCATNIQARTPDQPDARAAEAGQRLLEVSRSSGPASRDRSARISEIIHAQEVLKRFHGVQVHSLVA